MQGYFKFSMITFFSGVSLQKSTFLMYDTLNRQPLREDILFTLIKILHAYPVQF